MKPLGKTVVAAATMVAVALVCVGCGTSGSSAAVAQGSASVSPAAPTAITTAIAATPLPSDVPTTAVTMPSAGVLPPGTYVMAPFVGIESANACYTPPQPGCIETAADDSIRVTITVPAGWEVDPLRLGVWLTGKNNGPPGGASVFVERGGWLYSDPCHSSPSTNIKVGPSADDFANALANDRSLDTTKPVPVTLGASSGMYMDLQIPPDISACDDYRPWEPGFFAQGPSQRWHLWILDVTGVRVVIVATDYAATSAADRTALHAIVDSIRLTAEPG